MGKVYKYKILASRPHLPLDETEEVTEDGELDFRYCFGNQFSGLCDLLNLPQWQNRHSIGNQVLRPLLPPQSPPMADEAARARFYTFILFPTLFILFYTFYTFLYFA